MKTLIVSAARAATGAGAWQTVPPDVASAILLLTVSAAAAGGGDLLDVWVQSSIDGGVTPDDFVRFTQVVGNGGAKQYRALWVRDAAPTTPQGAANNKAIAAGVQQGPVGLLWRVAYTITDGGGGVQLFTFGVTAQIFRSASRA